MDREYWELQLEIIELLDEHCGGVIGFINSPTEFTVRTRMFDEDICKTLDILCQSNNMTWCVGTFEYGKNHKSRRSNVDGKLLRRRNVSWREYVKYVERVERHLIEKNQKVEFKFKLKQ